MLRKTLRSLWKLQPRGLRRFELDVIERFLTPALPAQRPLSAGDVIVCGFLGTMSGLGQGARQMLDFLQQKQIPVHGANASRLLALDDFEAGDIWPTGATAGGMIVFHINPDVLGLVVRALGRQRLTQRRVVGLWAWELETPPKRWQRAVAWVDEIWAPSHFVAAAMRKIAKGKPVYVVPYIYDVKAVRTEPRRDPLPALHGKTIVFFAYDVRSLHARKNPEAVVEAFRRAAGDRPDAALVIKINNNDAWPESALRVRRAAEGLPHVVVMHDKLSDDAMQDLIARVDIVMSLHRSEGFGMLMANAMAAAKPVIATGWSANVDFMTADCSVLVDYKLVPIEDPQHIFDQHEGRWAEPDVSHAAAALQRLLDDPAERTRLGRAARAHAEQVFSQEAWLKNLPPSFLQAIARRPG